MKLRYLIDVNLPRRFAIWANDDCEFVHDLGASWSDQQVWAYAAKNRLTIVSKDADFSALAVLRKGPRVIHIRVGNCRIGELHAFLSKQWPDICRLSAECRIVQVYADRIEGIE